jgi:hypothetical protein
MVSFEERICRNGQTSISGTIGRNAPYSLNDPFNPLKS